MIIMGSGPPRHYREMQYHECWMIVQQAYNKDLQLRNETSLDDGRDLLEQPGAYSMISLQPLSDLLIYGCTGW